MIEKFLKETWSSPVFGDTFPKNDQAKLLAWAQEQLNAIAYQVSSNLIANISAGMPELTSDQVTKIVKNEIIPKTIAFCPALTIGEIKDQTQLGAVTSAVALMYWGDQTMDRGDEFMPKAIDLLGTKTIAAPPKVGARLKTLAAIEQNISRFTKPADKPYVLACFYDQVLKHESQIHKLSQNYLVTTDKTAFLRAHARSIAEITTISAGFPSISSSLYAIYRQHRPNLPPLKAVYTNNSMTLLLQACNVVVRLWDDMGDWYMDSGNDTAKGQFAINPFNNYHPDTIQHFCELAQIHDPKIIEKLQQAAAKFHQNRQPYTADILQILREHIRNYFANIDPLAKNQFEFYIDICKRVMEIGYVNRIGDIALAVSE